jgi:hypothetical protein
MDGLVISKYGGINNSAQYTRLVSNEIPDFYEALTNELAQLTGMPRRDPSFPFLAMNKDGVSSQTGALSTLPLIAKETSASRGLKNRRSHHARRTRAAAAPGTLAEQLVTLATQYVVDKIMEDAEKTYKNAKQYAVDLMWQCAWTATAVAITNQVRNDLGGKQIDEVFSGASLSFREFQAAPAWIEADAASDPKLNTVLIIGPNLITKIATPTQDLLQNMKDGYNVVGQANNPKAYKNQDEVKNDLWAILMNIKSGFNDVSDAIKTESKLAMQSPDEVLNGCLLPSPENVRQCRQLIYHDGFKPVYAYTPPDGFETLSGFPVPIIFVVYNKDDFAMSFGTPSFMPCAYTNDSPKKIKCPNSAPFPP